MAKSEIDSLINSSPLTPFQWRLFWLCGFGWALDMFAFTAVGKLISAVSGRYGLSESQEGLYSTVSYAGMFFGAEIWGRVCDSHGRRTAFLGTLVVSTTFYFVISPCDKFWQLFLCLFGIGIGSGGGLVTRGTLLVEWLPLSKRGILVGALGVFWPVGGTLASAIAWLTIGQIDEPWCGGKSNCGWRVYFLALGLVQLLFTACFAWPLTVESARWYHLHGRRAEAKKLLQRAFPAPSASTVLLRDDGETEKHENEDEDKEEDGEGRQQASPPVSELFHPSLRRTTIVLWIIWAVFSFGVAAFYTLLPTLLKNQGFSTNTQNVIYFVANTGGIPGAVCSALLLETDWGRKKTLIAALSLSAVAQILVLAAAHSGSAVAMGAVCWMQQALTMSAWAVLFAYTPEVYPTTLRTRALGSANMLDRVGGVVGPYIGGLLISKSQSAALVLFSVAVGAAAVASWLLEIETKGRPLAEALDDGDGSGAEEGA